jgi:CBS-domain-containing membrane protein
MTHHVIGVKLDQKIEECLALMTGKFVRHLPVVDEHQRIVGIISIGDAVKELMAEQVFVIDQLVNYIAGEKPQPAVPEKSEVEL